jgi:hypothetical protein
VGRRSVAGHKLTRALPQLWRKPVRLLSASDGAGLRGGGKQDEVHDGVGAKGGELANGPRLAGGYSKTLFELSSHKSSLGRWHCAQVRGRFGDRRIDLEKPCVDR